MITKAVKLAQETKSTVKVETKPTTSLFTSELITQMKLVDSSLTTKECNCAIQSLVDSGDLEKVSYVVGTTGCGKALTATVLREKVATETKKV